MRRPTLALALALALVALMGASAACNSAEKEVRSQARLLCKYGQLEEPNQDLLPNELAISELVAADDLAWLKAQETAKDGDSENPFAQLAEGMMAAMEPAAAALREVMAENTDCEIRSVEVKNGSASVAVVQRRPDLSTVEGFSGFDGLARMGELAELDSQGERRSKVQSWLADAKAESEAEHRIVLVREGEKWRIRYGLQARAEAARKARIAEVVEQLRQKVAVAEKDLQKAKAAGAALSRFEVRKARFYKRSSGFGMVKPIIDLTVQNGTDAAVRRAYFQGVLKSPERQVPWLEQSFNYEVPGGVEPGEEARWKLAPNMFSEWGEVEAPRDAVLEVSVLRLDGPDGEALWSIEGLKATQEEMQQYQRWIADLQADKADPDTIEREIRGSVFD